MQTDFPETAKEIKTKAKKIKIENIAYNNPITVSPISYYSIIHFNYIIYTMLRPFLSKYAHIKFRYKTNPKIMSNALKKCQ